MGVQVQDLTKGKMPHEKEFIDFSFDGKYISEFGMVAVFDGDRHTFAASPSFDNETTEVNGAAGQLFWGSNIKSLKRTFHLATDGMTEIQVNEFKKHFQPGRYGKFIEDKLAYRYGYCRVAEVIEFKVVPFQKRIKFLGFPVDVNEYKGEATITFEWDDPYMYSTMNYIEEKDAPTKEDYISVAKAVYNNGIPLYSSWVGNFFRKYGSELGKAILGIMLLGWPSRLTSKLCHLGQDKCLSFNGSRTDPKSELVPDTGHSDITVGNPLIFYNPSNVLTPATITLTFNPHWTTINADNWQPVYFDNIADDINWRVAGYAENRNCIEGTSKLNALEEKEIVNGKECILKAIYMPDLDEFTHKFYYTNPSVFYYINRAIQIAYNYYLKGVASAVELEEQLRAEIVHDKVSKWAISILALIRSNNTLCDKNDVFTANTVSISLTPFGENTSCSANWFAYFNIEMLKFITKNNVFQPFSITFDGKHSETKIQYGYNQMAINGSTTFFDNQEELCGEVMLSPYFYLEGGDTVDEYGYISSCHSLQFRQGGLIINVPHVTLKYDYIYQ